MSEVQHPTTGRILHYRLSASDCERIEAQRGDRGDGARLFQGSHPTPGDVVPLVVVRRWPDEFPNAEVTCGVNGQAILDGNDTLWITSAPHGAGDGEWTWPPRV